MLESIEERNLWVRLSSSAQSVLLVWDDLCNET